MLCCHIVCILIKMIIYCFEIPTFHAFYGWFVVLLGYFIGPWKQVGVFHSICSPIRSSDVRESINHEHQNYCISWMNIKIVFHKVVTSVVWCVVANLLEGRVASIFNVGNSVLEMEVKVAAKFMYLYTDYTALPSLLFSVKSFYTCK